MYKYFSVISEERKKGEKYIYIKQVWSMMPYVARQIYLGYDALLLNL